MTCGYSSVVERSIAVRMVTSSILVVRFLLNFFVFSGAITMVNFSILRETKSATIAPQRTSEPGSSKDGRPCGEQRRKFEHIYAKKKRRKVFVQELH